MLRNPSEQSPFIIISRLVLLIGIAIARPLSAGAADESGSVQELISQLESRDLQVRRDAVRMLAEEAPIDATAVPALIEALQDRDRQVWAGAIQALTRLGDDAAEAVPALLEQLRSSDGQRRYRAAYALGRVGTTRWSILREALQDDNVRQRLGIVQAFGWMGVTAAPVIEELAQLLGSDSEQLADAAARSLCQIGEPAVIPLTNAAQSPSAQVRQRVATAFGQLDRSTSATIESLRLLANDNAPAVRAAALQAFGASHLKIRSSRAC